MTKLGENFADGKQVKLGVVLSYAMIIFNTLCGLFFTPYILSSLGDAEYGVYKTISSLTASMMVLDLGMGGTVMRYVAKYRASKEEHKIPNFVAMSLVQAAILCVGVAIVSVVLFFTLEPTYSATFSDAQLAKAKLLFVVLAVNMMLHVMENVINGVITGSNHFIFGNGMKLARLGIRVVVIWALLKVAPNSVVVVLVDLGLTVLTILFELFYIRQTLKFRIKLTRWEKSVFIESGKYTVLMFLTSIAAQVNNNVDNVVIGAVSGPNLVTIYSMGLLIFAMYENLSTSISSVMLPTVTNILAEDNAQEKIQNLTVRVGRVQFMLLGAAVVSFFCVGKDFINIWLGKGYEDVYIITLILMLPSLFELCVNVCLAVLRAKNMLGFRTAVLFGSTILNIIVTFVLVKYWSYIGAAYGTAVSFVIGSLVIMNIYYYKKFKFPMLKIYGRILSRIWLCLALAGGTLFAVSRYLNGSLWALMINVIVFCVVYGGTLLLFGLDKAEKAQLPIINKFVKKRESNND